MTYFSLIFTPFKKLKIKYYVGFMKKISSIDEYKKQVRNKKLFILIWQLSIFIIFICAWEVSTKLKLIDSFLISSPSAITSLFFEYALNNTLWPHIYISVMETILGLFIGTTLGFIIATVLYLFPTISKILDPYLIVLNALPKTALAPILIIWAGTNIKGIVVVSISLSIVVTIISMLSYFKNVDENLIKMMKTMSANKLQILFKVVYPSNIDNILSVIKVNIGMSWVGVIVGEFLVSREGIGYLVVYGGQVFKLDLVMMGVFILAIIALIMYQMVNIIEWLINKKRNKIHK